MPKLTNEQKFNNQLDRAERGAFSRVSAFIILRGAQYIGRVKFAHGVQGGVKAFIWDWSNEAETTVQYADGTFPNYAMQGVTLCGVTITGADYWYNELEAAGLTVIQAV